MSSNKSTALTASSSVWSVDLTGVAHSGWMRYGGSRLHIRLNCGVTEVEQPLEMAHPFQASLSGIESPLHALPDMRLALVVLDVSHFYLGRDELSVEGAEDLQAAPNFAHGL